MKHGKKYVDSFKAIDKAKQYDAPEALELAAKGAKAKFDETIELHIRLGVDSRHADQQVRGAEHGLRNGDGFVGSTAEVDATSTNILTKPD